MTRFAALADRLRDEALTFPAGGNARGSLLVSAGDNILPGREFNASLNLPASEPFFDAVALRLIGYDVLGVGNHEFDLSPDVFQQLIEDVNPLGTPPADIIPFVTANLDFSGEPGLAALQPDRLAPSRSSRSTAAASASLAQPPRTCRSSPAFATLRRAPSPRRCRPR